MTHLGNIRPACGVGVGAAVRGDGGKGWGRGGGESCDGVVSSNGADTISWGMERRRSGWWCLAFSQSHRFRVIPQHFQPRLVLRPPAAVTNILPRPFCSRVRAGRQSYRSREGGGGGRRRQDKIEEGGDEESWVCGLLEEGKKNGTGK